MTTQNTSLAQARALTLPSREAMLQRAPSVQHFWDSNRALLQNAWTDWETAEKDRLLTLDDSLLASALREAVRAAWQNPEKEIAVQDLWTEVAPSVFTAQFFAPERLAEFRDYLTQAAEAQIPTRPPYGIALNRFGAMLDERSEGHLAAPNFQAFYRDVMDSYMRPISRLLFPEIVGYDTQTFGFSIQYDPDKDASLDAHTDASAVTLNINLNLPDEAFTGSEVDFYDNASGKITQVTFTPGSAMIHRGNIPHATHPITSGQRSNMVLWLYGDRMQVPRGGASSYGNFSDNAPAVRTPRHIDARTRWRMPDTPLDVFAPF